MLMSRAIPRRLLVDSIEWHKLSGVDRWNKPTYAPPVIVKYVRFDNLKKNVLNSTGESKDDKATLFVDYRNSSPRVDYAKGDKITFNGNEYTIREIDELKGDSSVIHHYEMALV
jgi:hypothetical protein